MKFQDSSFNGLKVTVCTKSVTHAPTNGRSKSNMPHQLFQSYGHNNPAADQRLCFRYMDNTIPLISKSKISSL